MTVSPTAAPRYNSPNVIGKTAEGVRATRVVGSPSQTPVVGTGAIGPPASSNCAVSIGATPWAEVWIDGRDMKRHTPVMRLPLTCGSHVINLKRRDLQLNFQSEVNIEPGLDLKKVYRLNADDRTILDASTSR